uniref:Insulin like growth factor binding protein 7 n=1 Tax=Laticauda laticaudata TaxID=8630 RepID=A0A8C5RCN9_LATLA
MRAIWCAPSCLLFLLGCAASLEEPGAAAGGCSPCVPDECPPLPAWGCPLGRVRDNCGCCWRCARGEGEACGSGVSAGVTVVWGRCATGLECRRRTKSRGATAVCVCKSRYPVCGSDGLTYPSTCQLRAASLRAKSRGERPSIVTPPKDIWNVSGAQVYLSCDHVQRVELLPGDRDNLAVQTRGGPEKHEVTGWVLISPLSKDDAGEYECHASNSKGEATASGKITVLNSLNEIPAKGT